MKCGGRFYQRSLTILTELLISYFHACPVGAVKINEYRIPTSKSEPMAITSDPDGALWFTEGYGNKIGQVVIASAPSAPTPGIGQATVSFSALASSGGSAITGYTVTSNPTGGNDTDAGSTSLTHIVTELASGTTYSFTVTATNAVGTSTSLPSKTITPATVPGAPTIGIVTAGNRQASVNFTPVSTQNDGGSPVEYYTATSNPGNIKGKSTSSPIVVKGLTNGQSYTFTVTATNKVGPGQPSGSSNPPVIPTK